MCFFPVILLFLRRKHSGNAVSGPKFRRLDCDLWRKWGVTEELCYRSELRGCRWELRVSESTTRMKSAVFT